MSTFLAKKRHAGGHPRRQWEIPIDRVRSDRGTERRAAETPPLVGDSDHDRQRLGGSGEIEIACITLRRNCPSTRRRR
jgi:hypothetical protein